MMREDGKHPIGPKTHFSSTDQVNSIAAASSQFLSNLRRNPLLRFKSSLHPTPQQSSSIERTAALQDQYVSTHMLYLDLLEANRGITLPDEMRDTIRRGFQKEFTYLLQNPHAQPKSLETIIFSYPQLGQPISKYESDLNQLVHTERHNFDQQLQNNIISAQNATIPSGLPADILKISKAQQSGDIPRQILHDSAEIQRTRHKLYLLQGQVGVRQQITKALDLCKDVLARTNELANNPEFIQLTPEERHEYLDYMRHDIDQEQAELQRSLSLDLTNLKQLHAYDKIQLTSTDATPFLPIPRHLQRDLSTIQAVPYDIRYQDDLVAHIDKNKPSSNDRQLPNELLMLPSELVKDIQHNDMSQSERIPQFVFDSKHIHNECAPLAVHYIRCLRSHPWDHEQECLSTSSELYTCQRRQTIQQNVHSSSSSQSWSQRLLGWIWGPNANVVELAAESAAQSQRLPTLTHQQHAQQSQSQRDISRRQMEEFDIISSLAANSQRAQWEAVTQQQQQQAFQAGAPSHSPPDNIAPPTNPQLLRASQDATAIATMKSPSQFMPSSSSISNLLGRDIYQTDSLYAQRESPATSQLVRGDIEANLAPDSRRWHPFNDPEVLAKQRDTPHFDAFVSPWTNVKFAPPHRLDNSSATLIASRPTFDHFDTSPLYENMHDSREIQEQVAQDFAALERYGIDGLGQDKIRRARDNIELSFIPLDSSQRYQTSEQYEDNLARSLRESPADTISATSDPSWHYNAADHFNQPTPPPSTALPSGNSSPFPTIRSHQYFG